MRSLITRARNPLFVFVPLTLAALIYFAAASSAVGTVVVTGVEINHSSARIYFVPVPGAMDYRAYDVAVPNVVKYAGLAHLTPSPACPGQFCLNHFVTLSDGVTPVYPFQIAPGGSGGPQALDIPNPHIEWNNIGDGKVHTLVVEAVDRLGPVPQTSLYTGLQNTPLIAGSMLGGNKGNTPDGKNSTNGQGPYTNNPVAIAQSLPFAVQANQGRIMIPSKGTATQTFFDTFEQAENASIKQTYRNDTQADGIFNISPGVMKYSMNAGTSKEWQIEYRQSDNQDSMPFISSDHFMDMLFDGATPGTSAPTHTSYGSMSMTPVQTVNISGNQILHMTMEVDAHQTFRRWMDFNLAPASDPLQGWDPGTQGSPGHAINNSNQGIFLELKDGFCTLDIYTGPNGTGGAAPTGTAGGSNGSRLWGQPGSSGGGAVLCDTAQMYVPRNFSKNGLGLDDRSRFDFYISATHAALFQDGQLIVQSDIPAGSFPWANAPIKAYYSHYMYHSDADVFDLSNFSNAGQNICYPLNSFWFNDPVNGTVASQTICNTAYPPGYGFRYSDERHWDNMGFEALPSSEAPTNDFSVFALSVQPPRLTTGPGAPRNVRIIGLLMETLFRGGQPIAPRAYVPAK